MKEEEEEEPTTTSDDKSNNAKDEPESDSADTAAEIIPESTNT